MGDAAQDVLDAVNYLLYDDIAYADVWVRVLLQVDDIHDRSRQYEPDDADNAHDEYRELEALLRIYVVKQLVRFIN